MMFTKIDLKKVMNEKAMFIEQWGKQVEKNYDNLPKDIVWVEEYGMIVHLCPSCCEYLYEKDRCVFCGQKLNENIDVPEEAKPKTYEIEKNGIKYLAVTLGTSLEWYENGKLIYHASLKRAYSQEELQKYVERQVECK